MTRDGDGSADADAVRITAVYVLNELQKHTGECAKRWWALMMLMLSGFGGIILFLAGLVATLAFRGH